MTFPLRYADGNLLVGQGDARGALFRVDTVSYPFLPDTEKIRWLGRLARFAYAVEADFSLYRVCREYPAERYAEECLGMLDERHQDPFAWRDHLEGHEEHLRALRSFVPEVYVVVSLREESRQVGSKVLGVSDGLRRRLGRVARFAQRGVAESEVTSLRAAEERILQRARATLPIRRATTRELQWLLRRAAGRGVAEPRIDDHWAPAALEVTSPDGLVEFRPLSTTLERLANAPVLEQDRTLVIDAEEARCFQGMLALGALPEESEFPGAAELLFDPLERLSFPVDAVVHVRHVPNREAIGKVRRRIVDADNAYGEQLRSAHGPLSYSVEENRSMARELDAYLQSTERPPLLTTSVGLAVGAPDQTTLEQRVQALRDQYGTVQLHRPLGLQAAMFLDHLVRCDGGTVRDYADVLTVEQLGAMMPLGTHEAGSRYGPYIARTATGVGRPVRFDITEAPRENRPPSILAAGAQGSGKTFFAQLLALQAERRGSLVVDFDPKPDHNLEGLPQLAGRVDVMELSGDERMRGMLDPFLIGPPGARDDLAASYLTELLPTAPPSWETQIRKAARLVSLESNPCCARVLDHLEGSASLDAQHAFEALEVWADSGLARLAFGNGHQEVGHIRLPVTTIKAGQLNLPTPGVPRTDYDQSERLAVATLKLVAAYALALVTGDPSAHKVLLFDEAWFLLASKDGRRLIDRINRTGRAENATLILASQRLQDVGDIESLIGTRFIFGHETKDEARRAVELMGLDPDDRSLVDLVMSYRRGRGLMRDVDGRVAEVQIDPVYPDLLTLLDTSPEARARRRVA